MKPFLAILLLITLGAVGLPASFYLAQWLSNSYGMTVGNRHLEDFTWFDTADNAQQFSDFHEEVTIMFVGFLSCQVVCHQRIHEMLAVDRQLQNDSQIRKVKFFFVTIDPTSDTPSIRNDLIDHRSNNFYSARLSETDLDQLQVSLRENVIKNNEAIQHNGHIYLIGEGRKIEKIYSYPKLNIEQTVNDITEQLAQISRFTVTQM